MKKILCVLICVLLVVAGIAAIEGSSLGSALEKAAEKNIPVIAYDRLLMQSDARVLLRSLRS